MSVRLYVGNLPKEPIEQEALQAVFSDVADSVSVKVIEDRKTGNCRGFAFVTVPDDETANQFIEKYNGQTFKENPLKIEKALPRSKENAEEAAASDSADGGGANKRRNNKKRQRSSGKGSSSAESVEPDPRWADELAKLKERLAAQSKQ
ncbi:MAG: RNA-binding protein [Cyanobacteria bacterium QS_8_64_29]|jgi:RNA recognition motif-containing protein|nr:MAG: RNA-binding protein [Cyanobacteria bacterium QS_8_64_29]